MKNIFAIISILFGLSQAVTVPSFPAAYALCDTMAIPKIKCVDKKDSTLNLAAQRLADTINAATGTGTLVRSASPTLTGTLTVPTIAALSVSGTSSLTGAVTMGAYTSGRVPMFGTAGLVSQDNLYWDATNDRLGIGAAASSPGYALDVRGTAGFSSTITTPLTASLPVFTNGSSQLTTNAITGTGNVMMSASPTTTGTFTADASNFGGQISEEYGNSGGTVNVRVSNTSNTASSDARLNLITAGTSAGDPFVRFDVTGATAWALGSDNSVSGDPFRICSSGSLGSGSCFDITTAGAVTIPGAVTATNVTTGGGEAFTYGDTSFTLTGSTGWTTTPTGTAYGTRIGKFVTLTIPYMTGTSNSINTYLTGLPSSWTPATLYQRVSFQETTDNGVTTFGRSTARVDPTGTIRIYPDNSLGWTASGTKAIGESGGYEMTINYTLQ